MDLESELGRLLHTRDTPLQVLDPVTAVHAGMRRRRRSQRLQVLSAGLGVLVLAFGTTLTVNRHLAGDGTHQPAKNGIHPVREPAVVPRGFQALDVSFSSPTTAWALGTFPCSAGSCPLLVTSKDGGRTWERRAAPAATLPAGDGSFAADCAAATCVSQLRFASDRVGYAFAPGLTVTVDGGRTWTAQPLQGQVLALEPGRGTVLRVVDPQGACPCSGFTVERAQAGSTTWQPVDSSTGLNLISAGLTRYGSRAAVLQRGHVTGGSSDARSRLLLSNDDGRTWTPRGDPCGPLSQADEVDATQVALGASGRVIVLCRHRIGGATFTRVSADAGRTYHPARDLPTAGSLLAAADPAIVVSVGDGDPLRRRLLRSTDDGRTWVQVASQQTGIARGSEFLGFTTDRLGTWIGGDRRRLVRTSDGGSTWKDQPFS